VKTALLLLAITLSLVILVYPAYSASQTATDGPSDTAGIPGGIIPGDDAAGPVANVGAEHKFDDGFYAKIRGLIAEDPQDGDPGVYDGERYYNTIVVVGRDDGDGRNPDETARENKDAVVKRLETLGARDIAAAESLSFVTASIPVADVPGFSIHEEVYRLGDGELPVVSEVNRARQTIHATPDEIRAASGMNLNGSGIIVGVIDSGIRHDTAFDSRILQRVVCDDDGCNPSPASSVRGQEHPITTTTSHGTQVAQILAASGLPTHNGIAPGVDLLDIQHGGTIASVAHGLDHALRNGADIVNMSFRIFGSTTHALCGEDATQTTTHNLIVNEAVDKGMIAVKSAGNKGWQEGTADDAAYESITSPGCGSNVIAVGGINDRNPNNLMMFVNASRGPAGGTTILKPEIAAPAHRIDTLSFFANTITQSHRSGTSYAAPQVSATAAMMLQLKPDLTPVEIKAGLLLGADWQGPVPCTSSQYEQSNANNNCSHTRQPADHNTANNAASLGILNNVGFGILNASQSLEYVSQRNTTHNHVMGDHLDAQTTSRQYTFSVTDTQEPVKVTLTWFAHPHGNIPEQSSRIDPLPQVVRNFPVDVANLDFTVSAPSGTVIQRAESAHQTNEFAVFNPPQTGTYTVTVSGSGLDTINKPVQNYAIASTNSLSPLPVPFTNAPPIAQARTVTINPDQDEPVIVRLFGSDRNGDSVTFSVSDDPDHGTVTADEFISKTVSRLLYTPDSTFTTSDAFTVTPQDGFVTGTTAVITINAESLPAGSTDASPSSSNVRDWDTLEVTSGFAHAEYSQTFSGQSYPVSAIHVGSVNMEGVDLAITTTGGATYTVAIPPSGSRMIEFSSPITIRSATLSADGIDEEIIYVIDRQQSSLGQLYGIADLIFNFNDVRMFVGYVPSFCASGASGAAGSSSATPSACPAQASYHITTSPGLSIPDNTDAQDTSSTIVIPVNGTVVSLLTSVDITHTYIGDLKLTLTSPNGTDITLHNRAGGASDNIQTTYASSSNAGLGTLAGSYIVGNWTLSVGDYAAGDLGTLNEWSIDVAYLPANVTATPPVQTPQTQTTVFSDDFESGSLTAKWTETGEGDWRTSTSQSHAVPTLPGHPSSNLVLHSDNCDTTCTLTLKDPIDLTPYSGATLSLWRFVDFGLDPGEYLKVELYDGSTWITAFDWQASAGDDDNTWHSESYDLSSYLTASGFKMRLVTHQSSTSEDVQLDDIVINATSGGGTSTTPPPARQTTISEDFESGLDGWTLGGDSDWTTRSPTTQIPDSQTGNTVAYSSDCDTLCTMTLSAVDLSSRSAGHLTLDRFVSSSLDPGEYLKVELHDGSAWTTAFDWQASAGDDDSTWHTESYDLSPDHLVSELQLRITARSSSTSEVAMVDNISIQDSAPASDYSVYVADTDDREVLVFSSDGTYLDGFVDSRSGGLGRVWDVSFGPDGHMYASDNTNNKIRKYNGATGAPIGSSATGWASTVGFPNGLTWHDSSLYVATSRGVEKFSSSGSSLGYFGDASRSPTTTGATALVSPYDVIFCPDGRMYVADRSLNEVLYYRASDGTHLGEISGTALRPPNTYRASGVECGPAMTGSGTSLYQSGDDGGRINEINPSTGSLVRTVTSLIDEPYGMDMDGAGVLYVANKDDDNVVKISSGQSSVFASGNRMDDPRGVTVGPVYSSGASGQGSSQSEDAQNDEPGFVLMHNGTATHGPISLVTQLTSLAVQATDPEGDAVTIRIMQDELLLPEGAVSVTDHLNGTATVVVSSDGAAAGTYALWVEVSDVHGNYDREPYAVVVP